MARAWWGQLTADAQRHLAALWDAEEPTEAEPDGLVALLDTRFVESTEEDPRRVRSEEGWAYRSLYEWVVEHDDVSLWHHRTQMHICRAHPESRRRLRAGTIPVQFRCPLSRAQCPIRRIQSVEPGRAAVLSLEGLVPRSAVGRSAADRNPGGAWS